MPSTYISFDFGTKRMGAAVGNDLLKKGQALSPIKAKDGIPDWDVISHYIQEWRPKKIIVGLPLNMDGSESEMSLRAKKFAKRLHGRYHLDIELVDERLSSYEAKGQVTERYGSTDFGEHSVDGAAACLILESWFTMKDISNAE